jgi:hypothetical protein
MLRNLPGCCGIGPVCLGMLCELGVCHAQVSCPSSTIRVLEATDDPTWVWRLRKEFGCGKYVRNLGWSWRLFAL